MTVFDRYVTALENSPVLKSLDPEKRKKIIEESANRLKEEGILEPLHLSWDLDDDIEFDEESKEVEARLFDRESQIKMKQLEYGIQPIEKQEDEYDGVARNKWGKTALHEAVSSNDLELVKKLINDGNSLFIKDNNGHTPIHLAALDENVKMLKLFKDLGFSL